jgi:hypothetical protein
MVSSNSSALRMQMRQVREDLNEHADQVAEKARTSLDWRHFVANHPWASLAVAALAGYFVVPRRSCCNAVDAKTVNQAVERMVGAAQSSQRPAPSSVLGSMASAIAPILAREGLNYISQLARRWREPHDEVSADRPIAGSNY